MVRLINLFNYLLTYSLALTLTLILAGSPVLIEANYPLQHLQIRTSAVRILPIANFNNFAQPGEGRLSVPDTLR